MKKIFLTLAVMGMAAAGVSTAHAGVNVSIGIPAPVVVYREPAYCVPAPVYCPPARAYFAPPAVRLDFGFGGYRHFYRHG